MALQNKAGFNNLLFMICYKLNEVQIYIIILTYAIYNV